MNDGVIVLIIDDILEGGEPRHHEKIKRLESMYNFGKAKDLCTDDGVLFGGRRIWQFPNCDFKVTMKEYIDTRLHQIPVHKTHKKTMMKPDVDFKVETVTKDKAWCFRTCLPEGVRDCGSAFVDSKSVCVDAIAPQIFFGKHFLLESTFEVHATRKTKHICSQCSQGSDKCSRLLNRSDIRCFRNALGILLESSRNPSGIL